MSAKEVKEVAELLQKRIDWLTAMIVEYNKLLLSYSKSRNRLRIELLEAEKELETLKKKAEK